MSHLSKNINFLMRSKGIAHATELSRLSGVAQPTIHRWLNDSNRAPSHKCLLRIADYFNVKLDEILNEDLAGENGTPQPTKIELGTALRLDREALNISQSELARKIDVPSQSVSRWESGQMSPRDRRLEQLSSIFGVNSHTAIIAEKVLEVRYALRKKNGRYALPPSKKPNTRRFEASQRHSRFTMSGLDAYATDFYISNEGYFVIEQECDAMSVMLTSAQLEHLLKMMDYEELIEKVRAQEIEAAKPKSPDGADKS